MSQVHKVQVRQFRDQPWTTLTTFKTKEEADAVVAALHLVATYTYTRRVTLPMEVGPVKKDDSEIQLMRLRLWRYMQQGFNPGKKATCS